MVTAVATEEPEIAAKIAQAKMVAMPRPPGRWPIHLLPSSKSPLPTLPVSMIWLIRI